MAYNVPNGWPPVYTSCGGCAFGTQTTTPVSIGGTQTDAFGRLCVSQPYTLFDSQQRYELDWTFNSNVASGGSATFVPTQSTANLQVTSTIGSYAGRESRYVLTYQPGKSLLFMATFCMGPVSDSNLRIS